MEVMMMSSSSSSADVAWRLGRIMLKYRPIAPKPAATAGGCGGGSPPAVENGRGKKRKRKAPAGGTRRQQKRSAVITTLPLMPETPERKEEPAAAAAGSASQTSSSSPTSVSSFDVDDTGTVRAAVPRPPVWSSVTVEAVTDAWWNYEGEPFGYGVSDTCPAFVSEGFNRGVVVWANEAYRRMVGGGGEVARVALVMEGIAVVPAGVACFTCRVRVRYACGRRGKVSMVVPCDVWRLADGKTMVWRLDVKAALSLSSLS